MPLCPIPGRKGHSDDAGVASHGNGPFGQGRQIQHSDALDRLGRTQARHRRLAVKISKPFAGSKTDNDRPVPLNNKDEHIDATVAADARGRILAIAEVMVFFFKKFWGRAAPLLG